MDREDLKECAYHLYDGGWRSTDKAGLMEEYCISEEEAEYICECLEALEARE